jgi:mono/diheme cytochrome c family protein
MQRGLMLSLAAFLAAAPAFAEDIAAPAEPAAKAAFDMLDKNCARCHQSGKLKPGMSKPKAGFGNVLKLDELIASGKIVPGNPEASPVLKVMLPEASMPEDAINGDAKFPEPAEIEALSAWIKGLANSKTAACGTRKPVYGRDAVTAIASDLDKLRPDRAHGTRYLTLTNLSGTCASNEELDVYRKATIKLLNSLSRRSTVVKLETVDADQTIIRFNIADLGWDAADWEHVLTFYPYGVEYETHLFSTLASATGTKLPFIRADWFAFNASKPPLYDRLLKLPTDFHALLQEEGVDLERNIREYIAQRAGFQISGVSEHNRMIERHDSKSGFFWTSYDFAGSKADQNLFKNPLGPGGEFGFKHDGGETIFSLPNGFQGYYLNTADGKKLDRAPIEIVQDTTKDGDQTVVNGISCMSCHDRGMKPAKDEVRALVTADRGFPKHVHEAVEALYPPATKMSDIIARDESRFLDAMQEAGVLEPTKPGEPRKPVTLNGEEMINALANRYEQPVTIDLAAAEYGMTGTEFLEAAKASGVETLALLRRLEQQGMVPRDQFEVEYLDLVPKLSRDEPIHPRAAAQHVPPPSAGVPDKGFSLSVLANKTRYQLGDKAIFTVTSSRDCSLTLINIGKNGQGTIIFPTARRKDNTIHANQPISLGGGGPTYTANESGKETVIAICETGNAVTRGFEPTYNAGDFTDVGDYAKRSAEIAAESGRKRNLTVTDDGKPSATAKPAAPKPAAPKPASGAATARASITIEVH